MHGRADTFSAIFLDIRKIVFDESRSIVAQKVINNQKNPPKKSKEIIKY